MTDRVTKLAALSRQRDLLAPSVEVRYDPLDVLLPDALRNAKRITEYILAQPVYLTDNNRFTGMLRLGNAKTPADLFTRTGHPFFETERRELWRKNFDNLVAFEWQHSAPNYGFILKNGVEGSLQKIAASRISHRDEPQKLQYLDAVEAVCNGILAWSEHCADVHEQAARRCSDDLRRQELLALSQVCRTVPRSPAGSFYEGLQSILLCFQFLPDSVGTIDRALYPLYHRDIASGVLTRELAKDLIGEFFVHLSNYTPAGSGNADKSAECHFSIGGYTADGEDGFTDLSRLMVEALMEIDTRRPAISLRWTEKTPYSVLKFLLDCERKDQNKRLAFVSDEPRLRALQEICGLSYSEAVRYTMVGCNEPSFPGTLWLGGCTVNMVRSLVNTLFDRTDEVTACSDFEQFYAIYRQELEKDLMKILDYADRFNEARARDENVLSAFLLDGCIENALSPTRFGCSKLIGGIDAMGITCVIDSLTVIRQFVFEQKCTDMAHLIDTLKHDWQTDPDLHTQILRTGRFFGNSDPLSDGMARRFTTDLHDILAARPLCCGAPVLVGSLAGYYPHHMKFGAQTAATPDGRRSGEGFMVGTGQARGKDRKGLPALLSSLAQMDPTGILCGPNVCNVMIDEALIREESYFDSVCRMIEQYFKLGGLHIQLNYVSKEELLRAREVPEEYPNLKVRVSGFSATFTKLSNEIQTEILSRTVKQ